MCRPCLKENHSFQREISRFVNTDGFCPVCNDTILVPGVNDLETFAPWLNELWDDEKNGRAVASYIRNTYSNAYFKCPKGHKYQKQIRIQVAHGPGCMVCDDTHLEPEYNSVAAKYPDIIASWSPNNEFGPDRVMYNTSSPVLWRCNICSKDYWFLPSKKRNDEDDCPYCSGKKLLPDFNDLNSKDPELAKEFSPNNEVPANQILPSSGKSYKWICPVCHGEYTYPVNMRAVGDDSCPYCSGKKFLPDFNDLKSKDPELAKEFSPNNEVPANQVFPSSGKSYKWICPVCHGEYSYPVNMRAVGDDSCPYCSGKKFLPGYNSFTDRHQDLLNEWSEIDNLLNGIRPEEVFDNDSRDIWWICRKHEKPKKYPMPIRRRLLYQKRQMLSCPFCKGLRINIRRY